eukprot:3343191-Pleurochrysis_carterae.AAC.1
MVAAAAATAVAAAAATASAIAVAHANSSARARPMVRSTSDAMAARSLVQLSDTLGPTGRERPLRTRPTRTQVCIHTRRRTRRRTHRRTRPH